MKRGRVVFSDRYSVLGIPRPDPKTACCKCEGTGIYPLKIGGIRAPLVWRPALTDAEIRAWWKAHAEEARKTPRHEQDCDGWHFIQCALCGGTGKRGEEETRP